MDRKDKLAATPKGSPSVAVIFRPTSAKSEKTKRARMGGVDKTPEGPTPRKRKPSTRARSIKDMFQPAEKENQVVRKESSPVKVTKPEKTGPTAIKDKDVPEENVVVATANTPAQCENAGAVPSARWGHTWCMVSDGEAVLIGGQGDRQQISKDSIFVLGLEKHKWRVPETSVIQGQKPEARMGHTAVYDPTLRSIYVFGGSKQKRWFNDVHVLTIDDWTWQCIKANGKAPTRAYHSATLYRHELWIFGGVYPRPDPQPDGSSNDIHVFSPIEESWYKPIVMGEPPVPRSGQSATLLTDRLVVFGGWDYPVVFNDLHVLDLGIIEWSQPKVNGTPPTPRSWHASSALSGNRVLIHGGYDGNLALDDSFIFNLDTFTWTNIKMETTMVPRCGHTCLCLPYRHENNDKDEVLVFGGGDNDGAFYDDLLDMMIPIQRQPLFSVLSDNT